MTLTHYGFKDPPLPGLWRAGKELDFIINYDTRLRRNGFGGQVKYRMGLSADRAGRDGGEED